MESIRGLFNVSLRWRNNQPTPVEGNTCHAARCSSWWVTTWSGGFTHCGWSFDEPPAFATTVTGEFCPLFFETKTYIGNMEGTYHGWKMTSDRDTCFFCWKGTGKGVVLFFFGGSRVGGWLWQVEGIGRWTPEHREKDDKMSLKHIFSSLFLPVRKSIKLFSSKKFHLLQVSFLWIRVSIFTHESSNRTDEPNGLYERRSWNSWWLPVPSMSSERDISSTWPFVEWRMWRCYPMLLEGKGGNISLWTEIVAKVTSKPQNTVIEIQHIAMGYPPFEDIISC